jgi:hypothetical protein
MVSSIKKARRSGGPSLLVSKKSRPVLALGRTRGVRIDDDIAADRADMLAGATAAGIAVMHQPVIAADMAHQHHDVAAAGRRHSGRRLRAREAANPVRRQIEIGPHFAKYVKRGLAAAEPMWTARWPAADDGRVAIGIAVIGTRLRAAGTPRLGARRNSVRAATVVADNLRAGRVAISVFRSCIRAGGCGDRKDRNEIQCIPEQKSTIQLLLMATP